MYRYCNHGLGFALDHHVYRLSLNAPSGLNNFSFFVCEGDRLGLCPRLARWSGLLSLTHREKDIFLECFPGGQLRSFPARDI